MFLQQFDDDHHASPQFPLCLNVDWKRLKTILDPASVVYLNFHLPHDLRTEWRLLFSSKLHGTITLIIKCWLYYSN